MQIAVGDILAHYEIIGKAKKDKILILHGWLRSSRDWNQIAQKLSSQYQVILLDLPGHGGTSMPVTQPFDTFAYANFILAFLKKLKLKDLTLIGHSFGGKISVIAASESQDIKKLFLVDISGVEDRSLVTRIKISFAKIVKKLPGKNYLIPPLASRDYKMAGELLPSFKKIVQQGVEKEARKISLPTFIVWGEKDQEVPVKYVQKLKGLIKGSKTRIVWGAEHHPHLEKPSKFLEIIKEYL